MSELLVNTIKKADGTGSLTVPAESGTVVTTASPSLGRRNLIINGAVQIDQRNGGSSVTTATNYVYPCDRWQVGYGSGGAITGQQSTTAPSGFTNSVGLSVNTTDDLSFAGDFYGVRTKIEGSSVAHLKWGTADAETITLSFWVRSSVTGTYVAGITNGAGNRSYPATYTVSSANTWEYKTITISGDTSGTWNTGNNVGLDLFFYLGAGTDYATGTANAWNASGYLQTSSQVGWISNTGATFYITGVQLEVGSVSTPYEHRSYGEELALCQRYFYGMKPSTGTSVWPATNEDSANGMYAIINFPVTMRSAPSVAYNGTITGTGNFRVNWVYSGSATISNFFGSYQSSPHSITIYGDKSNSVYGTGYAVGFEIGSGLDGYFGVSAEL